nr:reverse transcriptase domain-containing protein [Tanacetum cinerariifolium]
MAGPEPITHLNEGTSNQNSKSIIERHVPALKELLKEPSNRNLIKPMLLDFDDIQDVSDDEVQDDVKGKTKVDEEDLSKLFKRIIKFSSPGHRMPTNVKIYDGTGDPKDHVGRFVGIGNQGEWPMSVWCRMFQQTIDGKSRAWFDKLPSGSIDNWGSLQKKFLNRFEMLKACDKDSTKISKKARRANETLPHFKESWNSPEIWQAESLDKGRGARGKGGQRNNSPQKAKVINMVQSHPLNQKRKTIMTDEGWMNVPIIFPPIPARDISEEALVVEVEVEGYLTPVVLECRSKRKKQAVEPSEMKRPLTGRVSTTQKFAKKEHRHFRMGTVSYDRIKKADGSWRMCIDFKNINSACPKDYYPLPEIDSKIEAVMGFPLKCFLDAYKGYHKVHMPNEDEEKTAFYTNQGTYCYTKMPFRLKNARAMYQRHTSQPSKDQRHSGNAVTQNLGRNANPSREASGAKLFSLLKMALALRYISRRLRRYFEAHPITVITDQPIKQVLSKANTSGRLASYSVELAVYNITYEPRSAVKGQILADFINEVPVGSDAMPYQNRIHVRVNFESTNNQAEYEALLAGLRITKKIRVQSLSVNVDSKLVASQINGNYEDYVLSKLASVAFNHLTKEILVETLDVLSMDVEEINAVVEEEGETWMTPIINFLERGIWPEDHNKACALQTKISQYVMEERVLFKRSYLMPMLWYVGSLQSNYVNREIHMGACNMHLKARSVVAKTIRQGYYWPTMHRDAKEEIRKCDSCQIHSPIPKLPKTLMTSIMAPWPFFQWEMDVLGLLTEAPGKIRFIIVAVDYFTKWIDAKPLAKTTGKEEGSVNKEEMRLNLDLLTERREAAAIREARYKGKVEHYYNKRVRRMSFIVGEHVYRKNEASWVENLGKLGPKWEGPYLIVEAYQNGSYKLRIMDDMEEKRGKRGLVSLLVGSGRAPTSKIGSTGAASGMFRSSESSNDIAKDLKGRLAEHQESSERQRLPFLADLCINRPFKYNIRIV